MDRLRVPLLDGLGTAERWHIFLSNRVGRIATAGCLDVRKGGFGRKAFGPELMFGESEAEYELMPVDRPCNLAGPR